MTLVKVKKIKEEIGWINDPDATYYDTPCAGCPDYCDIDDPEDLTVEAYGAYQCQGIMQIRRTTIWHVDVEYTFLRHVTNLHGVPLRTEVTFEITGTGQSPDEAMRAAETQFAAMRLAEHKFDRPPIK